MSDDALPDEPTAAVQNTVAVVVPDAPADGPDRLQELQAQVAALQAALDAHYAAHAETVDELQEEEHGDIDDDTRADDERETTTQETQSGDRPIRRGIGGFLFGPIGRKR